MYLENVKIDTENKIDNKIIARKIFLSYPTKEFVGKENMEFDIMNEISTFFSIPIYHVQVAGSAKASYSFYKKTEFKEGESDLDIAIIDPSLFLKYTEVVFNVTDGFRNTEKFKSFNSYNQYCKNLAKGMFRPDLMPVCQEQVDWWEFFNKLSAKYYEKFKNINAGIYSSYIMFENRQGQNFELDGRGK